MAQTYEIPKPVISVNQGERLGFNAKDTINPSLALARSRRLPMSGQLKAFSIGTTHTTLEFYGGTICVIPNGRTINVIRQVREDLDTLKPQSIQPGKTFNGVSIE